MSKVNENEDCMNYKIFTHMFSPPWMVRRRSLGEIHDLASSSAANGSYVISPAIPDQTQALVLHHQEVM